jgi:hypothetical protein
MSQPFLLCPCGYAESWKPGATYCPKCGERMSIEDDYETEGDREPEGDWEGYEEAFEEE